MTRIYSAVTIIMERDTTAAPETAVTTAEKISTGAHFSVKNKTIVVSIK